MALKGFLFDGIRTSDHIILGLIVLKFL